MRQSALYRVDAKRGQLLGIAASQCVNLVFTMNYVERTLLGISRENDRVEPLATLIGTLIAFCLLADGKLCSLERDARQSDRCAFVVYDIVLNDDNQTMDLKNTDREKVSSNCDQLYQTYEEATNAVHLGQKRHECNTEPLYQTFDDEVISAVRLEQKLQISDEVVKRSGSCSSGQDSGIQ